MTLRLEVDGLDPFSLDDENGIIVSTFDLGFPAVRAITSDRPDADGEDDATAFFGGRAVALVATIVPNETWPRLAVLDRVGGFMRPDRRSYLYFDVDGSAIERRIRLRADQHSRPIVARDVQVQLAWRAPDGIQEAATETVETVSAAVDAEAGRAYDLTFDRTYPASSPVGAFTVTNAGNVAIYPVLRLYGPCTNPRIENQTTGQTFELTANGGLALAAGEYVEIDVRERTVRLLGDSAQSRYNRLDFAVSSWWRLVPGDNDLRYYPEAFTSPAAAEIRYRSSWL